MMKSKEPRMNYLPNDKLPPQAIELEEVVLGALMIEPKSILKIIRYFHHQVFYLKAHQQIYKAILFLFKKDNPVDLLTVTRQLKEWKVLEECGGAYYIAQLTRRVASASNLDYHARILFQEYLRRISIEQASVIMSAGYDISVDVLDLIGIFESSYLKLSGMIDHSEIETKDLLDDFADQVSSKKPSSSSVFVKRSVGIPSLDRIIMWAPNKLLLIAGASKAGKSKLASYLVWQLLRSDSQTSVLWVTLEDTAKDILAAFCSSKVLIKPKKILQRDTTDQEKMAIKRALEEWKNFDVEFIDTSVSIKDIQRRASVFSKNRSDRFIIIVIDNLLSLNDRERFSRNMIDFYDYAIGVAADIRRDNNAFVFLLHHLKDDYSNEAYLEKGFRPQLTDIKGTEASRRVPTYTLLINNTGSHKVLLNQYSGEKRYILERMMIIDPGAVRDDSNQGDETLIRLYSNLDFNLFRGI
jgi:replicative DNA helicase